MKKLLFLLFALVVSIGNAWADNKTIYLNPAGFDNNGNWASDDAVFSAYVSNGGGDGWIPFTETVSIDGKECYKAEIPDSWTGMILVRQNPNGDISNWSSKWNQTGDIDFTAIADNTLFTITGWGDYSTSAVSSYSATFATGLEWENVYAYVWNGNIYGLGVWPGTKMTETSETFSIDGTAKTKYSVSFLSTAAPASILFNKGEGGAVGVNQTADLAFTDGKFYVLPTANPTAPTEPDTRVIAVFSKTYNKELTESNNGWGGGPDLKYTSFDFPVINDGHYVVHVNGTAINGRASATLDADHSTLHVALWPKTATSCKIWDDNKYDQATVYTSLTPGQWNYVEIDNVSFTTNYIGIELYNGANPETEFYLDHFYFSKPASGDATAPTFDTHALKSVNCISATLALQATDETSETITYKVIDTATSTVYQTTGASGTAIDFTISPLAASTEYVFSVVAMDENGNETAAETINATTTAIPDIPEITATENHLLWDGNDGGAKNGFNFESWEGGTGSVQTINGKNGYLITGFHYFGSGFTEVDASGMTYLEIDVLPSKSTTLGIVPINRNVDADGNQPEKGTQFNVTGGEWNKLMVPVADVIADGVTMTRLYQIKFISTVNKAAAGVTDGFGNGDGNTSFYIGNIYCWKETTVDEAKPVMVSATLASKTHNSATLTLNATDNSSKVKFHIVDATHSIDATTGLTDQGANFEYTVTGLTEETSYNFTVTAEDAAGNVSDNSIDMESFTTDAAPSGQVLVSGEHTILLNAYHYTGTENYEVVITSEEVMSGLGGSYWTINGVGGTRVDANMTISDGGKKLTITATSNQAPTLYTPLYVMMPGEVNFGQIEFTWIEKEGSDTPVTDKTIYLDPNMWSADSPSYAAYVFTGSVYDWIALTSVENTQFYTATIPGTWENMILVRLDPNESMSWDAKWNQTPDISLAGITDNTLFTITSWDGGADGKSSYSTSKYTVNASYTVSGHTITVNAYHYTGTENYEVVITSEEEMSGLGGSYWNINGVGGTRVDANMTISDGGKKITVTATSNQAPTLYTPLYVMMPGEVSFGQIEFTWVEKASTVTASVSQYKWATFCSDKDLDFTGITDVKAYIVTGSENGAVTTQQITGTVKAGTGMLLNSDAQGEFSIPVATGEGVDYSSTNKMHGVTAETETVNKAATGYTNYILTVKDGKAAFAYVNSTPATLDKGQAYLTLEGDTPTSAPVLSIGGDGEVTGIGSIDNGQQSTDNRWYDLSGRRVDNPTKGIYIVNGKKVVVK